MSRLHPGIGVASVAAQAVRRLLLPESDVSVVVQFVAVVVLGSWAVWRLRARSEWRLVVIGLTLVTLGAMGLRAAH